MSEELGIAILTRFKEVRGQAVNWLCAQRPSSTCELPQPFRAFCFLRLACCVAFAGEKAPRRARHAQGGLAAVEPCGPPRGAYLGGCTACRSLLPLLLFCPGWHIGAKHNGSDHLFQTTIANLPLSKLNSSSRVCPAPTPADRFPPWYCKTPTKPGRFRRS